MYKGKQKFSKEQFVFVIESIFDGLVDRIESSLPSAVGMKDYEDCTRESLEHSLSPMIESASMAVAIIYAQTTEDDCMEIMEAAEAMGWEDTINAYIKDNVKRKGKYLPRERITPCIHKKVVKFVESVFLQCED